MRIRYLGHSAFLIGEVLVDPFITGNPLYPGKGYEEAKVIAVTHGHGDHLGDAAKIAKEKGIPVVAIYEIAMYLSKKGVDVIGMNFGGTASVEGYNITMVPAVHSSGITEDDFTHSGGQAAGYIISKDGKSVYHAGDTMIFGDMKLIGDLFKIDVALLPIGGFYTMDTKQAVLAAKMLRPKYVIPMHYNTWPPIQANPEDMRPALKEEGIELIVLKPGEEFNL